MTTYNGHKNWNYWNVSLWINNDEGLYNLARDCIRETHDRRHAAALFCSHMDEMQQSKTPDGARYTVSAVRAAMVGM